ncbi:GH25 family lysozyme [Streptomyces sp. NPDC051320]|uniref:GH25 family lysozyme n=1 Tax=Streptomyces sp. NPDC051320 TaxID=3154644 RepID=UPI00343933A2
MMLEGEDLSSYQSTTRRTAGLAFTFVKATEGTNYVSDDPTGAHMIAQAAHARAGGHVVGFYHFLRPGSMTAQAAYFVAKAASIEGDILAADWEDGGVSCAQKDQFIREVKRLRPTHRVVLYCNTSFWKSRDTTSYAGDGLWIADPNHPAGEPGIKADWLFQQYSSAKGVDHNVANPAHFKTSSDLRAWAGGSAAQNQEDDDMQMNDVVDLNEWIPRHWPKDNGVKDAKIAVHTALGSTYGHARAAHDSADSALALLKTMSVKIDTQAAAITELAKAIGTVNTAIDIDDLTARVTDAIDAAARTAIEDIDVHLSVDQT